MERDLQYLAQLETLDNGKPLKDAIFDIYGAMFALKYYAGWLYRLILSLNPPQWKKII